MSELKTKPTNKSASVFLNAIEPEDKRKDSFEILKMMQDITGENPRMWGAAIIGFGMYHYKSERSTQEGDWPLIGFSPRKQNLTLYLTRGFKDDLKLLDKLGKHKTSVGCLYINKLSDIDKGVLKTLIKNSYFAMKKLYP